MSNGVDRFNAVVSGLREYYKSQSFVNIPEVKPRLEALCRMIDVDLDHRDEYCGCFIEIVNQLGAVAQVHRLKCDVYILDYCMRRFKWIEVEKALKSSYSSFTDPDVKLEVEGLIKTIFDRSWKEGRFKIVRYINMWD